MKVELIKGMSYFDGEIRVTKEKPCLEVSDEKGFSLISTGYFKAIDESEVVEPATEEPEGDTEYIVEPVNFEKMTLKELKAYADENEIDISGLATKPEIKQALLDAVNSLVPEIFTE